MKKWEYKVEETNKLSEEKLNLSGQRGCEVIAVTQLESDIGLGVFYTVVYKREKKNGKS